jgi:hypothetical protein
MSIDRLLRQPLTVQTVGSATTDAYGNSVPGVTSTFIALGFLEQGVSTEFQTDRDTSVSTWTAHIRVNRLDGAAWVPTVIGPLDRISFQGQIFQVSGVPEHAFNPRLQAVSHLICKLTVVT